MANNIQTRVFTKSTSNDKVTVYVPRKDFIDRITSVDPVEGVLTVDSNALQGSKVFVHVLAAFRYGRGDMDVMGLHCQKDMFYSCVQVYPPTEQKPRTEWQEQLMKSLGPNAYPFLFEIPSNLADTVRLVSSMGEKDKQIGVSYELKAYIADNKEDKPQSGSSVRLGIRKLTYAPPEMAPQPKDVVVRTFVLGSGSIRLESSLDKEKYYHGEKIAINSTIDNNSSRTIKRIRFSVIQYTSLQLHDDTTTSLELCQKEFMEGFPIDNTQTGVSKVHIIGITVADCRHKSGVALDGHVMHDDTHLASSSIVTRESQREQLGIVVSYAVKVKLILGFGTKDLSLELPFTLTHPPEPTLVQPQKLDDISYEPFARYRTDGRLGVDAED